MSNARINIKKEKHLGVHNSLRGLPLREVRKSWSWVKHYPLEHERRTVLHMILFCNITNQSKPSDVANLKEHDLKPQILNMTYGLIEPVTTVTSQFQGVLRMATL